MLRTNVDSTSQLNTLKNAIKKTRPGSLFLSSWETKVSKAFKAEEINDEKKHQLLAHFWKPKDPYQASIDLENIALEQFRQIVLPKDSVTRKPIRRNNWISPVDQKSEKKPTAKSAQPTLTIEERLTRLEEENRILRVKVDKLENDNYLSTLEKRKTEQEMSVIMSHESLIEFYSHLKTKLKERFAGYLANRSGVVAFDSKANAAVDGIVALATIPIPVIGAPVSRVLNWANSKKQIRKMKRINLIDQSDLISVTFVRKLTIGYKNQLKLISGESAKAVAKYAESIITKALMSGIITPNDSQDEILKKLFDCIRENKASYFANKKLKATDDDKTPYAEGLFSRCSIGRNEGRLSDEARIALEKQYPDKTIIVIHDETWIIDIEGRAGDKQEPYYFLHLKKQFPVSEMNPTNHISETIIDYLYKDHYDSSNMTDKDVYKYGCREELYPEEINTILRKQSKIVARMKSRHRRSTVIDGQVPISPEHETHFSFNATGLLFSPTLPITDENTVKATTAVAASPKLG
jgi:hypothetical protein